VVQSVELLLDAATDAVVRGQWALLAAFGLPSQARHAGSFNAPHVTVAVRGSIDPAGESALSAAADGLPLPIRLGALCCFGRRRFVLVRLVVGDVRLLELHARVAAALGPDPDDPEVIGNLSPGRWTPHVTLAHRLSAEQVATALTVLDGSIECASTAVSCRRWDGDAKQAWPV